MIFTKWIDSNGDDFGKLILRVSTACFILVYGIEKITNPGMIEYIASLLTAIHLPGLVAYGVFVGEVLAPIMVLLGVRSKGAAAVMSFTMVVVILLGHTDEVFPLSEFTWFALELQMLFLLNSLTVMFLGAGKFAISSNHKWD